MESDDSQIGLYILVLVAFILRLGAWAYFGTGTIESEGAEYATIAKNLHSGLGFVGLVSPGPQVLFPPLYSILIYLGSFLTHDYELSGRLIALVMGTVLPLPVFSISSRLFGRRAGFVAAALAALHPLSIYLSFTVYSEGPYATLFLFSILATLRALERNSLGSWLLVGGCFAFCYLIRPEGAAAFAITMAFVGLAMRGTFSARVQRTALATAAFIVLALPEILFIYHATGKIALETKSTVLFSYTGARMLAAETHPGAEYLSPGGVSDVPSPTPDTPGGYPARWEEKWAIFGVSAQGEETGTFMRPYADVARTEHIAFDKVLTLVKNGVKLNLPIFFQRMASRWLGWLLSLFALIGVVVAILRDRGTVAQWYLIVISGTPILATFFVQWSDVRYYFIFPPLLYIWAGNGVAEAWSWAAARRVAQVGVCARLVQSGFAIPGLFALVVALSAIHYVPQLDSFNEFAPSRRSDKFLGLWLRDQLERPARIMGLTLPLSYHADAERHVYFPYSDEEVALRYIQTTKVDYIVLRPEAKFTKYYADWVAHGIPDARAHRLSLPDAIGTKIIVYRWHWNESSSAHGSAKE